LIKKDAINDDMIYIGSTKDIEERMCKHKRSCNNIKSHNYNCKVYKYIRDNGGWDEWKYEIIDEVEVALREDAARYEGEYIIKCDAINKLNEVVAGRTPKENREQNKERFSQKDKVYYQQNKDLILQKTKQYYEQNKDLISQKSKEYYQQNKVQIIQYKKQYHEQNREQINERRREQRRLAKLNTL
jgi:predicted GIY-YIG superfamily endonuclease